MKTTHTSFASMQKAFQILKVSTPIEPSIASASITDSTNIYHSDMIHGSNNISYSSRVINSANITQCYDVAHSQDCAHCYHIYYCIGCYETDNALFCIGLNNKHGGYWAFNKPVCKKEYYRLKAMIDLSAPWQLAP